MPLIKTILLTGVALDWAVAKALGLGYRHDDKFGRMCFRPQTERGVVAWDNKPLPYSTNWAYGGPIIEREEMLLAKSDGSVWPADTWIVAHSNDGAYLVAPTLLTAAMRALVAAKLGDEVDIPQEML